jgi:predicted MFS family arabinose efflux permease
LLVVLGVVGNAVGGCHAARALERSRLILKLLAIPLLFAQFRRSGNSEWVFVGYLASCVALLAATAIVMVTPWAPTLIHELDGNVLVKNARHKLVSSSPVYLELDVLCA